MNDDGVRRQLRFSLFLQAFAAVILTAVAVVRWVAFGPDWATLLLIAAVLLIIGAGLYTRSKIRVLGSPTEG